MKSAKIIALLLFVSASFSWDYLYDPLNEDFSRAFSITAWEIDDGSVSIGISGFRMMLSQIKEVDRDNALRLFDYQPNQFIPSISLVWEKFWATQGILLYDDDGYGIAHGYDPCGMEYLLSVGYASSNNGPGIPGFLSVSREINDGSMIDDYKYVDNSWKECSFWRAIPISDGPYSGFVAAVGWGIKRHAPAPPCRIGEVHVMNPSNLSCPLHMQLDADDPYDDNRMGYITFDYPYIVVAGDVKDQIDSITWEDDHQRVWILDSHSLEQLAGSTWSPDLSLCLSDIEAVEDNYPNRRYVTLGAASDSRAEGFTLCIWEYDVSAMELIILDSQYYSTPSGYFDIGPCCVFPEYDDASFNIPVGFHILSSITDSNGSIGVFSSYVAINEWTEREVEISSSFNYIDEIHRPVWIPSSDEATISDCVQLELESGEVLHIACGNISEPDDSEIFLNFPYSLWLFSPIFYCPPVDEDTFHGIIEEDHTISVELNGNPFSESVSLTICAGDYEGVTLTIYDINGRVIDCMTISEEEVYFIWEGTDRNGTEVPNGCYFVCVSNDAGHAVSRRLLKIE